MITCVSGKLVKICTGESQVKRIGHENKTRTTPKTIICFQHKVKCRNSPSHITFLEHTYCVVAAAQEITCPEMPREDDAGKVCG